jgi:hypothetical protein
LTIRSPNAPRARLRPRPVLPPGGGSERLWVRDPAEGAVLGFVLLGGRRAALGVIPVACFRAGLAVLVEELGFGA